VISLSAGPSVSFLLLRATLNLYKTGYIASVTESIVENED
ncbi:Os12g0291033, partial [Oryza sativa Japonica Group]